MIYNVKENKKWSNTQCLNCKHFVAPAPNMPKKCIGFGKRCFETDMLGNLIDPITKQIVNKKDIKED